MCLLFLSYRITPGYPLVVAANRDEFYRRPTAKLAMLDEKTGLMAGLDLEGGGTWLGVTGDGRMAAITNFREPAAFREGVPSRGEIILKYLNGTMCAAGYLEILQHCAFAYNGFNLIIADKNDCYYYSNKIKAPQLLAPGFYGLSNRYLDTPWPKVVRGKTLLWPYMIGVQEMNPEDIFTILLDSHQPPDRELPDTGIGLEWERLLGTIFIDGLGYGTRSSALISIGDSGRIDFTEKTYNRDGRQRTSVTTQLSWCV